ncbi:MAG: hypothetical protein ABI321_15280 [Polyangia bacterium]
MALTLARGETILFPMPYVEAERPPYVVTNQRLIERSPHGAGERVIPVKSLIATSRAKSRPYAAVGALFLCLALGAALAGGYLYSTVLGMEGAPYTALPKLFSSDAADGDETVNPEGGDEPARPAAPATEELPDDPSVDAHPEQAVYKMDVLKTRVSGIGLGALAFVFMLLGTRIFRKRRYFVVCRSRDGLMRIVVTGKTQQDIILATLQAVQ